MMYRSFAFLLLLLPAIHGFLLTPPIHKNGGVSTREEPFRLASSITMTQQQQPLAQHGDWQAYFDEDRYCLLYYFNTKTGDSQWEPPPDFPIPKLEPEDTPPEEEAPATVLLQSVLGFAATVATKASQAIVDHIGKTLAEKQKEQQQQQEISSRNENKPWWSILMSNIQPTKELKQQQQQQPSKTDIVDLLSEIRPSQRTNTFFENMDDTNAILRSNNNHMSTNTAQKQASFWKNHHWTNTHEPSRPVIPPSHREQRIQEKLYKDSLKRQENLRKNYRKVIENRSPTISLSALKRANKKDWLQYLNDDA